MAFKLAIGDSVEVPVSFSVKDAGQAKNFKFTLFCKRLPADEVSNVLQSKDTLIKEFLTEVVNGWEGQKLVLNDDGAPAAFSEEAFGLMLSVAGLPVVALNAYLKECGAKSKN